MTDKKRVARQQREMKSRFDRVRDRALRMLETGKIKPEQIETVISSAAAQLDRHESYAAHSQSAADRSRMDGVHLATLG